MRAWTTLIDKEKRIMVGTSQILDFHIIKVKMFKNLLFITGHRKSGTTMFANLFDGHKDFLVYPSDLCLLYAYYPFY